MPEASVVGHDGAEYQLRRCQRCGRRLTDPRPQGDDIESVYAADYYGSGPSKFIGPIEAAIDWFRWRRARQATRLMKSLQPAPGERQRVLDIGCGSGRFLEQLQRSGYECHGTELTARSAARATSIPGLTIRIGDLSSKDFPPSHFDLISIWHVLEHLPDPDRVLRDCAGWLKPGGAMMLAVPNIGSLQGRLFGKSWFHLDVPRHLFHFTPQSLRSAMEAAGLQVVEEHHLSWEQNLYGVLQSSLNALGFPRDDLYEVLKGTRRFRPFSGHLIQVLAVLVLLVPAVLFTLAEALMRRGGTLETIARRRADRP